MAENAENLWNKSDQERKASSLPKASLPAKGGIFPSQAIKDLIHRGFLKTANGNEILKDQIQPASLDLRLGKKAYRVRASFLPGNGRTVESQLEDFSLHEFSLEEGAVLERECFYVGEVEECLALPDSVSCFANPKSSTGRLDVFTRLISDGAEIFDYVEPGYEGKLYVEISPRTFSIKVGTGSRLNQLRFRRRIGQQDRFERPKLSDKELRILHAEEQLVDRAPTIRDGLNCRVDLKGMDGTNLIGYRAQKHTDIIDVDKPNAHKIEEFWEPIHARPDSRLILDPGEFYILVTKEAVHIPIGYAAEMVPIDPMMGEFRAHYAGFFDPGFGAECAGGKGSRAVLEVRSHDIPFILEDGQIIARLIYEPLTEIPKQVYGKDLKSNYQAQGLKLSKHFI